LGDKVKMKFLLSLLAALALATLPSTTFAGPAPACPAALPEVAGLAPAVTKNGGIWCAGLPSVCPVPPLQTVSVTVPKCFPRGGGCFQFTYSWNECAGPENTLTQSAYVLVTVIYAPPGNNSTVNYLSGRTMGIQHQIQVQTTGGFGTQVQVPGVQYSGSYMVGDATGNGTTDSTTMEVGQGVQSKADAIDHAKDQYWIWTNAAATIHVRATSASALGNVTGGYLPPYGGSMSVVPINMDELAGVVPISDPSTQQALAGLSAAQRESFLRSNPYYNPVHGQNTHRCTIVKDQQFCSKQPLVNPTPFIDPKRFALLSMSPITVRGPTGGNIPLLPFDTNQSNTHQDITGFARKTTGSLWAGDAFGFIENASAYGGIQWEDDYTSQDTTTTGTVTDAQGNLSSTTPCWVNTVNVMWDAMFGTYLFVPLDAGSSVCQH
jgi:hypothetical protein